MSLHSRQADREPLDVLELGEAIVAARPQLKRTLERLTADADHARNLLHATLTEAWRRRDAPGGADVHDWLLGVMKTRVLN